MPCPWSKSADYIRWIKNFINGRRAESIGNTLVVAHLGGTLRGDNSAYCNRQETTAETGTGGNSGGHISNWLLLICHWSIGSETMSPKKGQRG